MVVLVGSSSGGGGGGGGGGRARAGNRRQRRALGARCGGNQDLFNVSSNPGRGWKKNFFLEKSMEIFFFGSKRVGDNGWKSVSWGFGWEGFFWVRSDRSSSARFEKQKIPFLKNKTKERVD